MSFNRPATNLVVGIILGPAFKYVLQEFLRPDVTSRSRETYTGL